MDGIRARYVNGYMERNSRKKVRKALDNMTLWAFRYHWRWEAKMLHSSVHSLIYPCLGEAEFLQCGSWENAGPFCNLGNPVLPLNGHEMNARYALHPFEFLNLFNGKFDTFFGDFPFPSSP